MTPRRFAAIDELIAQIEAEDINHLDALRTIAVLFKAAVQSKADPYLLIAALVEDIARVIEQRVPTDNRRIVSVETVRLLRERLGAAN